MIYCPASFAAHWDTSNSFPFGSDRPLDWRTTLGRISDLPNDSKFRSECKPTKNVGHRHMFTEKQNYQKNTLVHFIIPTLTFPTLANNLAFWRYSFSKYVPVE